MTEFEQVGKVTPQSKLEKLMVNLINAIERLLIKPAHAHPAALTLDQDYMNVTEEARLADANPSAGSTASSRNRAPTSFAPKGKGVQSSHSSHKNAPEKNVIAQKMVSPEDTQIPEDHSHKLLRTAFANTDSKNKLIQKNTAWIPEKEESDLIFSDESINHLSREQSPPAYYINTVSPVNAFALIRPANDHLIKAAAPIDFFIDHPITVDRQNPPTAMVGPDKATLDANLNNDIAAMGATVHSTIASLKGRELNSRALDAKVLDKLELEETKLKDWAKQAENDLAAKKYSLPTTLDAAITYEKHIKDAYHYVKMSLDPSSPEEAAWLNEFEHNYNLVLNAAVQVLDPKALQQFINHNGAPLNFSELRELIVPLQAQAEIGKQYIHNKSVQLANSILSINDPDATINSSNLLTHQHAERLFENLIKEINGFQNNIDTASNDQQIVQDLRDPLEKAQTILKNHDDLVSELLQKDSIMMIIQQKRFEAKLANSSAEEDYVTWKTWFFETIEKLSPGYVALDIMRKMGLGVVLAHWMVTSEARDDRNFIREILKMIADNAAAAAAAAEAAAKNRHDTLWKEVLDDATFLSGNDAKAFDSKTSLDTSTKISIFSQKLTTHLQTLEKLSGELKITFTELAEAKAQYETAKRIEAEIDERLKEETIDQMLEEKKTNDFLQTWNDTAKAVLKLEEAFTLLREKTKQFEWLEDQYQAHQRATEIIEMNLNEAKLEYGLSLLAVPETDTPDSSTKALPPTEETTPPAPKEHRSIMTILFDILKPSASELKIPETSGTSFELPVVQTSMPEVLPHVEIS